MMKYIAVIIKNRFYFNARQRLAIRPANGASQFVPAGISGDRELDVAQCSTAHRQKAGILP